VILLAAVGLSGICLVLMPICIAALSRRDVLDRPNERSLHSAAVPRGGGIVPAFVGIAALWVVPDIPTQLRVGVIVAIAGFALIGLGDDLWRIAPVPRLILQAAVALGAAPLLISEMNGATVWRVVCAIAAIAFLASYVNAFNFMDGINGIAATQAIVAGAVYAMLGFLNNEDALLGAGLVLVAVSIGFIPYNFPRARVFLGDVGSYALGAWIAALAIAAVTVSIPLDAVLAPIAIFLYDTGLTLVRRVSAGEGVLTPHRRHIYQQIVQGGWSHTATTLYVALLTFACGGFGLLAATGGLTAHLGADIAIVGLLALYTSSPALFVRTTSSPL